MEQQASGGTPPGDRSVPELLDAIYDDPRLVALYDVLNPPGADTEFYARLAGSRSRSIVDIGCGTGAVALRLAAAGHRVTGLDPARAMLDAARERDIGGLVAWHQGDARSWPTSEVFDLAVMTGHMFQVLLADVDIDSALREARCHLRPGGTLAFETRNPAVRPWESWVPGVSRRVVRGTDGAEVVVEHRVLDVTGELVRFETAFQFADVDESIRSRSTLRFVSRDGLQDHLVRAGFDRITFYGDWDRGSVTDRSPELIAVAHVT